MIDLVLIAIIGIVTWCLAGEGAYSALTSLVNAIVSGLLAMNYFEPLANVLESSVVPEWANRWDMIALIGLFVFFFTAFRLISDKLVPTYVQVHPLLHQIGSWGGGFLTGYVVMAFLLTALHTAPFPRDYWGFFYAERDRRNGILNPMGPDYQWLGFTQYVTERPFAKTLVMRPSDNSDPFVMTRMFDGRNGWLWNIPPKDGNPQYDVMPSFPIRYASRRAQLGGVPVSTGGPAAQPQPRERQSGGSRGGSAF